MKDNLSRIMDRFNWWLFSTEIETVQEVRRKWLEFKQEYADTIIAEFERLKDKGVNLNEACNKKGN